MPETPRFPIAGKGATAYDMSAGMRRRLRYCPLGRRTRKTKNRNRFSLRDVAVAVQFGENDNKRLISTAQHGSGPMAGNGNTGNWGDPCCINDTPSFQKLRARASAVDHHISKGENSAIAIQAWIVIHRLRYRKPLQGIWGQESENFARRLWEINQ